MDAIVETTLDIIGYCTPLAVQLIAGLCVLSFMSGIFLMCEDLWNCEPKRKESRNVSPVSETVGADLDRVGHLHRSGADRSVQRAACDRCSA